MHIIETLIIAVMGGSIFYLLNTPLPWMLGAISSLLLWNGFTKRKMVWPAKFWHVGLIIVGYTIGSTFTQDTAKAIIAQLPIMAVVTMITIFFNLLMGYLTYDKTDISLASGLMGSIPGGLSQVAALCQEVKEADLTVVTFMQTARVLSVVFIVPFLAVHGLGGDISQVSGVVGNSISHTANVTATDGVLLLAVVPLSGYVAKKMHLPTPYLLGPVLGTACLNLTGAVVPALPKVWISMAQLSIGIYTGARMSVEELKNCKQLIPFTITSLTGLLLLSVGIGWILNYMGQMPLITAFLSTAPGGIAEMSLTAIQVHADLSVVVAFQLFRLLIILIVVPPSLKWWLKRQKAISVST